MPLLSIPAYYFLALTPRFYAHYLMSKANFIPEYTNPYSSIHQNKLLKAVPACTVAAIERANSAHRNDMENLPLFVAAVFAGLMAEQIGGQGCTSLQRFVGIWMVSRVVYTVVYCAAEREARAWPRSLMFHVGWLAAFEQIWSAAKVVGGR